MKALIKSMDFYGKETKLLLKNAPRHKSFLGGLLSLVSLILLLGVSIFFVQRFFKREDSTTISNIIATNEISIQYDKQPLMIRLSDSYGQVLPDKEKYWTIVLKVWYGGVNETDPLKKSVQWNHDIPMEPCDINTHFGEYQSFFQNFTDLSTFYCPNFNGMNDTLIGVYGGVNNFNYHHYYITKCKTNCKDKAVVDKYLSITYLDTRTIDFMTNSLDQIPYFPYVRSDRHMLSASVYKRIWMFVQAVEYSSDNGLIFSDTTDYSYHQVDNFRNDVDLRDTTGGTIPGTFANLSILNYQAKIKYFRYYMKAQNLLANIGGVISGITVLARILFVFIAAKLYTLKLINSSLIFI
jgi:hypothetical protein